MAFSALLGGALSAGGDLLGARLGRGAASTGAKKAKKLYMRRYQLTMDDMRRAGLNPILAYQGIGGQPPNVAAAKVPNMMQGMVSSAVAAGRAANEIKLLKSQHERTKSETKATDKLSNLRVEDINLRRREIERVAAGTKQIKAETTALVTRLPGQLSREALDKTTYGRLMRWVDMTMKSVLGKGGSGDMR